MGNRKKWRANVDSATLHETKDGEREIVYIGIDVNEIMVDEVLLLAIHK